MAFNYHYDAEHFIRLISQARLELASIRADCAPEPSEEAAAYAAFDPYIARRLNTFLPVRVIEPPSSSQTWMRLDEFLDGWQDFAKLARTYCISTWEVSSSRFNAGTVLALISPRSSS